MQEETRGEEIEDIETGDDLDEDFRDDEMVYKRMKTIHCSIKEMTVIKSSFYLFLIWTEIS